MCPMLSQTYDTFILATLNKVETFTNSQSLPSQFASDPQYKSDAGMNGFGQDCTW